MSERAADRTEVLVVGGGPAGSTTAALLAREGLDVTLLERERFPRYHIGESLLPSLLPVLDLLGARQAVERQGFVRKSGAYYDWGGQRWALRFAGLGGETGAGTGVGTGVGTSTSPGPGPGPGYSFQVVRSAFDQVLLEHARQAGAVVREGVSVRGITFGEGRPVEAAYASRDGDHGAGSGGGKRAEGGRIAFEHLVDASGRAGVLAARQLRTRRFHDVFRNVATWGYWRGAAPVAAAPDGAICVFSLPDHGWFWAIPLHDGTLSVGLVTDKRSFSAARQALGGTEAVYASRLRAVPALRGLLGGAALVSPLKVESDYSYTAERFCGPGYYLAGDAACFLDPLLSTGVHLAMYSGLLAAAAIATVRRGEAAEAEAQAFYQGAYRHAYERLLILVGAFYDVHRGRDAYFRRAQALSHRDQQHLRLHESFLNIISGVEDLRDAEHSATAAALLLDRLQTPLPGHSAAGLGGHGTGRMTPWPTTPDRAVAGLYLAREPRLGLRRTS
ncbi:NAD(P)/FAD-dependent oxidoreductase [Streptomyces sp. XH2]|uniref:NAD(P)/FAD-dependent oxidoreductase n=1 Tax=Streptomyces sp. XH2 TaxID=3412483 RepID=UPI003C7C3E59